MTTTDAVERELTALESALLDTLRVMRKPGPDFVAALAAVHARLPDLPLDPAAQLLRIRALTLDAHLAWCGPRDAATAVAGYDEVVALCRGLVDEGTVATAAADHAVEVCTDTAMVFLGCSNLAAAQLRLQRADAICETCDVKAVLRLDLLNVWTFVDFGYARFGQALRRAEAAVALGREVGGESMVSAVANLAQACRRLGDRERALSLYGQILVSPERTSAQDQSARLGQAVTTALIDPGRAVPLLLDVVERSQHEQGGENLAHAAATLGSIAQADRKFDEARHWYAVSAGATTAPPIVAGGYCLMARVSEDPVEAARLRRQARRVAGAESVELQVMFDFITSRDALEHRVTEPETTMALTSALVMDAWRIELPGSLRESWQQVEQASGTGLVLRLAQDLSQHDLVAAVAAHLCAIVPPDRDDPRPPRVLVDGTDPLATVARAAVERYDRPIRDEERTVDAYSGQGLDLVAVGHGDVYLCWRRPTGVMYSVRVSRDGLDADLAELEQASGAALAPAGASALLRWSTEVDLMRRLGERLLPPTLVSDLTYLATPRLRVRADGGLAAVPWGLLVVPGMTGDNGSDTRLVELVDQVTLAPFGLPVPAGASPRAPTDGGVVAVLDPRVPGFPADSALGSVLGRMPAGSTLEQRMRTYLDSGRLVGQPTLEGLFRRRDQDRTWLAEALATRPARLLYLGHVSTVTLTDGVTSEPALHLCCSAAVPGHAAPLGAHRPLAASDVLADESRWPARVALVACASGDDARTRDAYGLAHAVLCRGAELVTGLLWPLPTGRWYRELATESGDGQADEDPVVALTLAVDQAHESPDPVRSICQWQRDRLRRWRTSQSLPDSPIGWGGLHTIVRTVDE